MYLEFDVIKLFCALWIRLHQETVFQITLCLNILAINHLASDSPKFDSGGRSRSELSFHSLVFVIHFLSSVTPPGILFRSSSLLVVLVGMVLKMLGYARGRRLTGSEDYSNADIRSWHSVPSAFDILMFL